MKIGLVGLGKMGSNLALNLHDHGIDVVGCDPDEATRCKLSNEGVKSVATFKELLQQLPQKKIIWLMVPSGAVTESCMDDAKHYLQENDIVIDGGNSNYKDSMRHYQALKEKGIRFLDVGTSGGMSGARNGACFMVGGSREAFDEMKDVFYSIAQKDGCMYTGKAGSGHFMKMVHNGIEYGMMQAIAEGFHVLEKSEFDYDLAQVADNWNHGSVIRGWLMELAKMQFSKHPGLKDIKGVVAASGEAKWTVETALEMEVPVPVIALSLMIRNASLEDDSFSCKVVSALRNGFGGHAYVEAGKEEQR